MFSKVLITNGGTHPPEKWAMTTAEQVFDIGSGVAGDRLIQAQKLQLAIAETLMPHHAKVQADESGKLVEDAAAILSPFNVAAYLDDVIKDIVGVAKGTMWEAHFAKPEVQAAARDAIGDHFAASINIERLTHADRHPDCEFAQAYRARVGA